MDKCTEVPGADPDFLLVDGNRFGDHLIPRRCLVKGESRSISIAAASILAMEYRDRLMAQLHEEYPYFGWDSNVGYPTCKHNKGITKMGYTVHHWNNHHLGTKHAYQMAVI